MLELRGVTKTFGAFQALKSVDFSVSAGEVVALVGANGAGKSTLMKVLAGVYPDATYAAKLHGQPLILSSPTAALRAGIGVVQQEIDLVPDFTVAENMLLGREPIRRYGFGLRLTRPRQMREQAASVLRAAGLDLLDPDAVVATLPIEMQQIVQVAKVLALDSKVVVLDEPTARLSADGRARLFAVVARLRAAGSMIVFISHYLEEVFEIADRIVVLRDGALVGSYRVADLTISRLIRHMVGELATAAGHPRVAHGPVVLQVERLASEPHFCAISFSVASGEVVGIAGIIGSGRHELVRSLIGEHPAEGSVSVAGKPVVRSSAAAVIGRHIGFVPEDRKRDGIIPDRSVAANLSLPCLRELSAAGVVLDGRVSQRARELVRRLRLACSAISQPVRELSGGNQQKAVLGRWFGAATPVVVLEAPTVGVDVAGKEEIRQLVRSLATSGTAVVVSTDDLWELEHLTDRILVMVRGELSVEFDTRTMRHTDLVVSLIGAAGVRERGPAESGMTTAAGRHQR